MKDNKLKQFIEEVRAISLTSKEKDEIKNSVLSFVHSRRPSDRLYVRRATQWFFSDAYSIRWAVAGLSVLMVTTTGFSSAAESALPGDFLYKFKVNFNEKVVSGLKFSDADEINWDIERMSRRLEEAESLALSGRMDLNTGELIGGQFDETAKKIQDRVLSLKKIDEVLARDLDNNFIISIQAHHNVMSQIAGENEGLQNLISIIDDTMSTISAETLTEPKKLEIAPLESVKVNPKKKIDESAIDSLESQAYQKRQDVEDIIRSVKESINSEDNIFSENFINDINSRVSQAQNLLTSGSSSLYQEKFAEAIADFNEATILMGETRLIIDINEKLKINFWTSTKKFQLEGI